MHALLREERECAVSRAILQPRGKYQWSNQFGLLNLGAALRAVFLLRRRKRAEISLSLFLLKSQLGNPFRKRALCTVAPAVSC